MKTALALRQESLPVGLMSTALLSYWFASFALHCYEVGL